MNKAFVSVLCGSSALSFGLLTASAAQAEALVSPAPAPQYEATLVNPSSENDVVQTTNYARWRAMTLDSSSDTVGDAAIAMIGCDCPGCRNMALQAMQTGRSTLER